MANFWYRNKQNFDINSAQGHWNRIMFYSKGIDRGEVIVITGEHADINYEYLLDLWSFSLPHALYFSCGGHSWNQIIDDYKSARMYPENKEIGIERWIEVQKKFDINQLESAFRSINPDVIFIENINWTDSFEEKINRLKKFAKDHNVPIFVEVNPKYVNLDDVLNSTSLNKIYYFTNCSITLYLKGQDGIKIPTTTFGRYFRIIEDEHGDIKHLKSKEAKKQFEKLKAQHKLPDWQALESNIEQEEEKEEKLEKGKYCEG